MFKELFDISRYLIGRYIYIFVFNLLKFALLSVKGIKTLNLFLLFVQ